MLLASKTLHISESSLYCLKWEKAKGQFLLLAHAFEKTDIHHVSTFTEGIPAPQHRTVSLTDLFEQRSQKMMYNDSKMQQK